MSRPLLLVVLTLALLAGTGCAGSGGATPHDAVRGYREALQDADLEQARAVIHPAVRATRSERAVRERFERLLAQRPVLLPMLRAGEETPAVVEAVLERSDASPVRMEVRDGAWVITGGVAEFGDTRSARGTLLTFAVAVEGRDLSGIRAVMPSAYREQVSDEALSAWYDTHGDRLRSVARAVRRALRDEEVFVDGERASLAIGGGSVSLVREGSAWVIDSFDDLATDLP